MVIESGLSVAASFTLISSSPCLCTILEKSHLRFLSPALCSVSVTYIAEFTASRLIKGDVQDADISIE
jgi:hypothetical protein